MRRTHTYSRRTTDTVGWLGLELARARRERRVSQEDLADRAGISIGTLASIERGAPTVAIGTVFEIAHLLGVDILTDAESLPAATRNARATLKLLPSRVREPVTVDDDF